MVGLATTILLEFPLCVTLFFLFEPFCTYIVHPPSQFVAFVLRESGIWRPEKDVFLIRPQDFSAIPGARLVYQGRLNDYAAQRPRLLPLPKVPA